MRTLCIVLLVLLGAVAPSQADPERVVDPTRPVVEITRTSVTIAYFTHEPAPTRVQVRQGRSWAETTGLMAEPDPWEGEVRVVEGAPGLRRAHRVTIYQLAPGTRYYYRVYAPDESPRGDERAWAAAPPWRREYAVSTLAPEGERTVIHHPVKVLLMPNVINIPSALDARDAPHPEPMDSDTLALLQRELQTAARFLYVNSGMRFWPDFQVVVDDRWQQWNRPIPEDQRAALDPFYADWPVCRSYAGMDYRSPGGGRFTILDTADPDRINDDPVRESESPFPSQIEIACPRKWNPETQEWTWYRSGGGTLGIESISRGIPGRSQFFGGYDTAWLATHEFHHQMESLGSTSLANREDERIVYNHWSPRSRDRAPDAASSPTGDARPHPWTTSARHGEHYDGMAYWDRTLTDAQWLRMIVGDTITVRDADNDGFPDDDPRLPLDEHRFGSDPTTPTTDGVMNDLAKAMLSTWAPAPLQDSFYKPAQTFARPDPRSTDSDNDGWPDTEDPDPLAPFEPIVWPVRAIVDANATEWERVPLTGLLETPKGTVTLQHGADNDAYYALITIDGDFERIRIVLDGEGAGVYSGEGVMAFQIFPGVETRLEPTSWGFKGLEWKASHDADTGRTTVELSIANWTDEGWYWKLGGREVGVTLEAIAERGARWSMYEPYRPLYCRMQSWTGVDPKPGIAPEPLADADAHAVLLPGDDRLISEGGWKFADGALAHSGNTEDAIYIEGLRAHEFDICAEIEARSDAIIAAFVEGQPRMGALYDYVAFVGGYANTRTRFRLFGAETSDSATMTKPGRHTLQLSRRDGAIWALWDGEPILWAKDPRPDAIVDRLALLGGYGGAQKVYNVRYRATPAKQDNSDP